MQEERVMTDVQCPDQCTNQCTNQGRTDNRRQKRRVAGTVGLLGAIAFASLGVTLGGCTATQPTVSSTPGVTATATAGNGSTLDTSTPDTSTPDTSTAGTSTPGATPLAGEPVPATLAAAALQPQAYWLETIGNRLVLRPEPVSVPSSGTARVTPEVQMRASLETLLKGQPNPALSSSIPSDTQLLDLEIRPTGIYVNLSKEFAEGGGSTALIERVAQVIFTVTSTDPERPVYFSVDGKPVDENHPLGGEGLVLKQPTTRREFAADYPLS